MNYKSQIQKYWNSPTLMTWLSYSTKSLSILLITPLIVSRLTSAEIVIWYIFASFIALSGLADFGFRNTFIRFISYAFGGAKDIDLSENLNSPNWDLISKLLKQMKVIYIFLSIFVFLLVLIGGYLLINGLVTNDNSTEIYLSLLILSVGISLDFYGKIYSNYLEGLNKIALVRRVESILKIIIILLSFFVLFVYSSLLLLIVVTSFGLVLNTFRNFYLAKIVYDSKYVKLKKYEFDKVFAYKIWVPAWKSGVSGFVNIITTNFINFFVTSYYSIEFSASFLFAMRFLNEVKTISNAPFYSKIPYLNSLYSKNELDNLIRISQKAMFRSHLVFSLGIISIGIFMPYFLAFIDSKLIFIEIEIWLLLCFSIFIFRIGAMHIQLISITNLVKSHIADTVSLLLFVILLYSTYNIYPSFAIVISLLVSYLAFYLPYALFLSYKKLSINLLVFESKSSLVPLLMIVLYYFLHICSSL
jgi:hypothetical protein